MKHKNLLLVLLIGVFLISTICASADTADKTVVFKIGSKYYLVDNGSGLKETKMDASPYIKNGRTYIPIRFLGDALGATTNWGASTRTATVSMDNNQVSLTIGSKTGKANGQNITMDVAPEINSKRTMLPARYVAEAFGYTVTWDTANKLVICTRGNASANKQAILNKYKTLGPQPGQIYWHSDDIEKIAKELEAKGYKVLLEDPYKLSFMTDNHYNDYGEIYIEGHVKDPNRKQWEKDVYQAVLKFAGKSAADMVQERYKFLDDPICYVINVVGTYGSKKDKYVGFFKKENEYDSVTGKFYPTDKFHIMLSTKIPDATW